MSTQSRASREQPRGNQVPSRASSTSSSLTLQNSVASLDAKIPRRCARPATGLATAHSSTGSPETAGSLARLLALPPAAPSADHALSNGLRDINQRQIRSRSLRVRGLPQVLLRHRPRFQRPVLPRRNLLQAEAVHRPLSPPTTKSSPTIPRASDSVPLASQRHGPHRARPENRRRPRTTRRSSSAYPGSDEDPSPRAKLKETRRLRHRHPLTPPPCSFSCSGDFTSPSFPAYSPRARSSFRPQGEISLRSCLSNFLISAFYFLVFLPSPHPSPLDKKPRRCITLACFGSPGGNTGESRMMNKHGNFSILPANGIYFGARGSPLRAKHT